MGNKMPAWVDQAVAEFSKRLHDNVFLNIIEIPLIRRNKTSDLKRIMDREMQMITAAIPIAARLIALDITGKAFTSQQLAEKISQIQHITSHLCFLIGGPEGLSPFLVAKCDERWSLSNLTLPHTIVRIVLLEALYRAMSILQNHPYHK